MRKLALGEFEACARNGPTRASTGSRDGKLKIRNKPGLTRPVMPNAVISLCFFCSSNFILFSSEASHAVNYERVAIRHLSLMFDTFKQDSNVISKIKASLLGQVQQEVKVCQTLPVGLALGLAHIVLQLLLPCRQLRDRAHSLAWRRRASHTAHSEAPHSTAACVAHHTQPASPWGVRRFSMAKSVCSGPS